MARRDQLRAKRIARGAKAIAARAGLVDAPWARRHVHAWQAVMCRALDKQLGRCALLFAHTCYAWGA